MRFRDRIDAGQQLAIALVQYKGKSGVIVLALPRGGVVVAAEVARALKAPLDIVVPRKIGAPGNEEFAIGALTEDGNVVLNDAVVAQYDIPQQYIEATIEKEKKEAARRLAVYRGDRPRLDLNNKIVIIVDDGIATGLTMEAAIASVKARGAAKIIVAVPVAAPDSIARIRALVDDVVCLYIPNSFSAVGEFYEEFEQVTDGEVIELLSHYD